MNSIDGSDVAERRDAVRSHGDHTTPADPPIAVICGPTAAGKSALALALAQDVPTTIISADSRQIYRGFDIGTAKPTPDELALVPHAGIDVADPTERWSAWQWASAARDAIAQARAAGRVPLVVGGTGFYIRALVMPLAPIPPLDDRARERLAAWLDTQTPEALQRWCARLDAPRAALGPTQWRRAIEVALLTGVPLSAWHTQARDLPALSARYLVVDPGGSLADRIARRVHGMIEAGWGDEVDRLQSSVPASAPAWQATGYEVMRAWRRGQATRDEAVQRVIVQTRQYAKRQRTWFRHQLGDAPVLHVAPQVADEVARARRWWNTHCQETQ